MLGEKDGRRPDFIMIGSMKAGSTTLFRYLTAHPQVFRCRIKELQFFSRDHVYERGFDWYESNFTDAKDDQICGEASTCYTRWPHFGNVAERIHAYVPNVKLIYLMRHPVSRAYSHYKHLMEERSRSGEEPITTFEEALEEIPEIIDTSRYVMQIERYLEYFERDQFLFLTLDGLKRERAAVMEKTFDFLGVDPDIQATMTESIENRSGTPIKKLKADQFVSRLRHTSGLSRVIDLIPKETRSEIRRWLVNSSLSYIVAKSHIEAFQKQLSPLSAETRESLLDVFYESTKELENFINHKLPDWYR